MYERHPWVAQNLYKAFCESKRLCAEAMYEYSRAQVHAGLVHRADGEGKGGPGPDAWAYGLEPNRHVLETLVGYAHEQGLTRQRLEVDSLFAPSTLNEFKV